MSESNIKSVAIIGAGLTGCSLAYHFHLLGIKTVVLESRNISEGSTGRNGGILHPSSDCAFELRTAEKMKEFISKFEADSSFEINSSPTTLPTEDEISQEANENKNSDNSGLSLHSKSCDLITDKGGAVLLDSSLPKPEDEDEDILPELVDREMKPDPNTFMSARKGAFRRGFQDPMAFSFWPAKVVLALARESSEHTCYIPNCKVLSIEKYTENDKNGIKVMDQSKPKDTHLPPFPYRLKTTKGPLHARIVIVSTNAWIPELLPQLQTNLRIVTNTVLQTRNPLPLPLRWPVCTVTCGHGASEIYINQRMSGHLVIGGLREKEA